MQALASEASQTGKGMQKERKGVAGYQRERACRILKTLLDGFQAKRFSEKGNGGKRTKNCNQLSVLRMG